MAPSRMLGLRSVAFVIVIVTVIAFFVVSSIVFVIVDLTHGSS